MTFYALAGMIVVSIALVVYALWPKSDEASEIIKRRMTGKTEPEGAARKERATAVKRLMDTVTPIAVRPSMTRDAGELSKLRLKLAMAGLRGEGAPMTFLASKTIVAICLGAAAAGVAFTGGYPLTSAAGLIMIGLGVGFLAPNLWLSSAVSKRSDRIRQGLPDTLDMLVISVEAGLGLDAALQRVGDEMREVHPPLAEELQLITLETQMGVPRIEALSNFARRAGVDEVKSMVAIVNQAERFGTSIARALRNQSDALRVKRRQAAEERAQKTTVKLMAPLILFIFPAILVVLAGPAALTMIDAMWDSPNLF